MRWTARLAFAIALGAQLSAAEPLDPREVPAPLAPWVPWVLRGHEEQRCPFLDGSERRACAWPSRLELDVDDHTGRFVQRWQVYRDVQVALPGDAHRWPEDVRADGQPVAVIAAGGGPGVRLAPGDHELRGSFRWDALPELLQVPAETGIVRLRLRGAEVAWPDRDGEGRLWLARTAETGTDPSRPGLEVSVHRRLSDEVPLLLETRVQLRVSGRSREVVLGRALPEGFEPLALAGPLPLRLDPDARLRAQVRAGTWDLVLLARHAGPAQRIELPDPAGTWDDSEEWVFEAHPEVRVAAIEEAPAIDPSQTTLPAEWQALPAYRLEPGHGLRLVERQRGDADPAPDELALERVLWLDFDGRGATASDALQGTIRRSARLEMRPGTELGRAALAGSDQLITRLEGSEQLGIGVAPGPLVLNADSRTSATGSFFSRRLAAIGWDADVQSLHALLHLPPGWGLLHARGVDRASESWYERWTYLDSFAVAVLAVAFGSLWGARWGVLALIGLALTWTETGAPHWTWGAVLAAEAVRRALRPGRAPRLARAVALYRFAALALLLLLAIPFAVHQIRTALYPALERPGQAIATDVLAQTAPERLAAAAGEGAIAELGKKEARARVFTRADAALESLSSRPGSPELAPLDRPDPRASVTTGPGLPAWTWTQVDLRWSGPVQRDQSVQLLLLPPFAQSVLALIRVGLLTALVGCVLGVSTGALRDLRGAAGIAGAVWLALMPVGAHAELPTPELLDELRHRLLEPPECQPHCAEIARLALELEPRALRARLDVHAQADTAVALPGGGRGFAPERVLVAGRPAAGLLRGADGALWVQVSAGRSEVIAEGALPERDAIELALPSLPRRVELHADGWNVHGVREDGVPDATLQLERIRADGEAARPALETRELPPFVRVERHLALGLEWQVATRVDRLSPADTALSLSIPLLPGESITSDGVRAQDGRALITLPPGSGSVAWSSVLSQQPQLELRAASEPAIGERWQLDASPVWHIETRGIPPLHRPGTRTREWHPWPGESVALSVRRPAGIEGATATLDAAALSLRPGLRATDAELRLTLRSSRGGQHDLALPEGAELRRVAVEGDELPVRQQDRTVRVPLRPGTQSIALAWREPRGARTLVYRGSQVDLGMPVVNAQIEIAPSPARWTLFTRGPRIGPSVLFWPLLLAVAGIAWALGRASAATGLTPLRFGHWLGLGVGLTQVPVVASAIVVLWLLALGWRRERGTQLRGAWFDVLQLALAGLTVAALVVLFLAIRQGLLGSPAMQIAGNGSSAELLRWYQDRSGPALPQPAVVSVPLGCYRAAMFAWAGWLGYALVGWLRWGWSCFAAGELWRPLRRRVAG
jgi:hypothetical protein